MDFNGVCQIYKKFKLICDLPLITFTGTGSKGNPKEF